jgi:hypothetical protein
MTSKYFKSAALFGALLLALVSVLSSCQSPPSTTALPQLQFVDVIGAVFDAQSARLAGSPSFSSTSGHLTTSFSGTPASGTFLMSFTNFLAPSLCVYGKSCVCTGILKGTFIEGASSGSDETSPGSTPYTPNPTPSPTPDPTTDASVTTAYIALKIDFQNSSLSTDCDKQIDRTIQLQIHNDKTMVISDSGKEILFSARQTSN